MSRLFAGANARHDLSVVAAILTNSLVAILAFADASGGSGAAGITPNPLVQSALSALLSTNDAELLSGTTESLPARLNYLRSISGQETDLVLQLLYFHAHATNERETALFSLVVDQLALPNSTFAEAGIPLLESDDEATRHVAYGALARADHVRNGVVDFSRYETIMREDVQNIPQSLIRYMYDRNTQAALMSMSRVYGKAGDAWELADELKGDPRSVMQTFSSRPEWWVRLYVAEMMNKLPQLRDQSILATLESDDSPLVRAKIAEIISNE